MSSFGGQSDMTEKGGYLFKVIVVGEQSVGKSSILLQYTKKEFKSEYNVTIGFEFASKSIEIDTENDGRQQLTLQVWDTAGQETFKSIVRSFYQKSVAAFVVYNVNKRQSFLALDQWLQEIRQNAHQNIIIALIGNQIDQEEKREVSKEEGQEYANKNNINYFFETSAKQDTGIDEAFKRVSEEVYEKFIKNFQFQQYEDSANTTPRNSQSYNQLIQAMSPQTEDIGLNNRNKSFQLQPQQEPDGFAPENQDFPAVTAYDNNSNVKKDQKKKKGGCC